MFENYNVQMDSGQKINLQLGYTVLRLLCGCISVCVLVCVCVDLWYLWLCVCSCQLFNILNASTSSICDHYLDYHHATACDPYPCCCCACVPTTRRNDACRDCDTYPWTISMGFKKEIQIQNILVLLGLQKGFTFNEDAIIFSSKLKISRENLEWNFAIFMK